MDIIKKVRPLKASYESLSLQYKIIIVLMLVSLVGIIVPHSTEAHKPVATNNGLFFEIGDYDEFVAAHEVVIAKKYTHEQVVAKLKKQLELADKVEAYLASYGSPLAPYASTIIQQSNWKMILALSNAESSLCRRYVESTSNCWGVGGSDLWDMGDNLGQGVVSMNRFLNNYPLRSSEKYAQMSFDNMNGLYKQPAKQHWVDNNMAVFNDLVAIERGL